MTLKQELEDLVEEIRKALAVLDKILQCHRSFTEAEFRILGRNTVSAVMYAELIDKYYTALETLFMRIVQYYGNNLQGDRWHSDLLHKMTLTMSGVREAVLADSTAMTLQELMKFRHFRRYYLEIDYDWDKIDFLNKKLLEVAPRVESDLKCFADFLIALINPDEPH